MADAYAYDEADREEELRLVGKKLLQPGKSKDALVKLLKQAGSILEQCLQTSEPQRSAASDVAKALVSKHILDQKDKDVRICTALCFSHVLRLHAPDTPYTPENLQAIFRMFFWIFRRLEDTSSASFQQCVSVLDVISQVKCCLLLLDLDMGDELCCELFGMAFDIINQDNAATITPALLEVLVSIIDESDDISQRLLDTILTSLVHPKKDESPPAYRLAQQLLQRAEQRLQPYLQKFLTNVIVGAPTESDLSEDYHNLIFQVYQTVPQTLLPVLPHLIMELHVDAEASRLKAVELMGRLFSLPGSDMDTTYSELFTEFLRRLKDQKVEVRLRVLSFAKDLLANCSSAASRDQVLAALLERLMDFDDKVRAHAVACICEAAIAGSELVGLKALEMASQRLRDKKLAVRKEAANQLARVFRAYCTKSHGGERVASDEELVMWIPARLAWTVLKDPELAPYILDSVLKANSFFPAKLTPGAAALQWAAIYLHSPPADRAAFMRLVRGSGVLRADVQRFLELHQAAKSPDEGFEESKLQALQKRIAAVFPDPMKGEEGLIRLREVRDNHVFKGLRELVAPGTPLEAAASVAKDVCQRVGAKGPAADCVRTLCNRLQPSLLSPEHLDALFALAIEPDNDADGPWLTAICDLLEDAAAAAPALFAHLGEQAAGMLTSDDVALSVVGAKVLARSGAFVRAHKSERAGEFLEQVKPALLQLCAGGPVSASKAAVRALNGLMSPDEQATELAALCKDWTGRLQKASGAKALPLLTSLSAGGRLQPAAFAPHAAAVSDYVLEKLLPSRLAPKSKRADAPAELWGSPSEHVRIKAAALKTLAHAFVPDVPPAGTASFRAAPPREIATLVKPLTEMLLELGEPENDLAEFEPAEGDVDVGVVRLAAGAAALRLARGFDGQIPAETYLQVALMMQDQMLEVRHDFAAKVRRAVQYFGQEGAPHQKAAKYAAMLPLAGMDPSEDNRRAAMGYLVEYVVGRRRAARAGAASAAAALGGSGGTTLHECPDFLLPFLVQILAHHPDFPTDELLQEEGPTVYEPFQRMLQFGLEPLLAQGEAGEPAGAALPAVLRILRTLKQTEDITECPQSQNMYILCDMAIALSQALVAKQVGRDPNPGKYPGSVPLPTALFRPLDRAHHARQQDGSHLPAGLSIEPGPSFLQPPSAAAGGRAQGAGGRGRKKEPRTRRASTGGEGTEAARTPVRARSKGAAKEAAGDESCMKSQARKRAARSEEARDHAGGGISMSAGSRGGSDVETSGADDEDEEDLVEDDMEAEVLPGSGGRQSRPEERMREQQAARAERAAKRHKGEGGTPSSGPASTAPSEREEQPGPSNGPSQDGVEADAAGASNSGKAGRTAEPSALPAARKGARKRGVPEPAADGTEEAEAGSGQAEPAAKARRSAAAAKGDPSPVEKPQAEQQAAGKTRRGAAAARDQAAEGPNEPAAQPGPKPSKANAAKEGQMEGRSAEPAAVGAAPARPRSARGAGKDAGKAAKGGAAEKVEQDGAGKSEKDAGKAGAGTAAKETGQNGAGQSEKDGGEAGRGGAAKKAGPSGAGKASGKEADKSGKDAGKQAARVALPRRQPKRAGKLEASTEVPGDVDAAAPDLLAEASAGTSHDDDLENSGEDVNRRPADEKAKKTKQTAKKRAAQTPNVRNVRTRRR